ncbi:hypothetical protein GCM10023068_22350 [Leifsonia shinshuensis]
MEVEPEPEAGSDDGMVDPIVWLRAAFISVRLGSPAGACGPADGDADGVADGLGAGVAVDEPDGDGVGLGVAEAAAAGASAAVAGTAGTTATAVRMAAARTARPVFMVDTSALKGGEGEVRPFGSSGRPGSEGHAGSLARPCAVSGGRGPARRTPVRAAWR